MYDSTTIIRAFTIDDESTFKLRLISDELFSLCHTDEQREIAEYSLRTIRICKKRFSQNQFFSERPSYVNAMLIQLVENRPLSECTTCVLTRSRDLNPHPFPICRRLRHYFGNCCANCKFFDYDARCTLANESFISLLSASFSSSLASISPFFASSSPIKHENESNHERTFTTFFRSTRQTISKTDNKMNNSIVID